MNPRDFDLLALDVDGTLIGESREISPRLRQALDDVLRLGKRICLCTGRPLAATRKYLTDLRLCTPPIVFNGALIPSLDGDDPILCQALCDHAVHLLLKEARRHGDYLEVHTAGHCYVEQLGFVGEWQRRKLGIELVVGPVDDLLGREPILKCQFIIRSEDQRQRLLALERTMKEEAMLSWGVSPDFQGHFVNVMRPGVDKCSSLDFLLSMLGIPWERVFAAGDSRSDLAYVERAGRGVILGNAPEAVRREASLVIPPVEEDGLAQAIEQYVLA